MLQQKAPKARWVQSVMAEAPGKVLGESRVFLRDFQVSRVSRLPCMSRISRVSGISRFSRVFFGDSWAFLGLGFAVLRV